LISRSVVHQANLEARKKKQEATTEVQLRQADCRGSRSVRPVREWLECRAIRMRDEAILKLESTSGCLNLALVPPPAAAVSGMA
jgi:hypothetical protein